MIKRLPFLLMFASTLFAQSVGIPIISSVPLTAWQFDFGPGIVQASDGTSALFVGYGNHVSADLGVTPLELQLPIGQTREGAYQFSFSVENSFAFYPGYYTLEIDFGTQELCETSGWGTQKFTQVILTCPAPGYIVVDQALPSGGPVQGAKDFVIHWTNPGWPVLIKNVSPMFTPSP